MEETMKTEQLKWIVYIGDIHILYI